MKLKLIVDDIPIQQLNNLCMQYDLEVDIKDMSITLYDEQRNQICQMKNH